MNNNLWDLPLMFRTYITEEFRDCLTSWAREQNTDCKDWYEFHYRYLPYVDKEMSRIWSEDLSDNDRSYYLWEFRNILNEKLVVINESLQGTRYEFS